MSDAHAEQLTAAIEQLSDDINGLMQVAEEGTLLKQLVDEVRVLREAIDDLRAEVEWAARNVMQHSDPRPLSAPVTSMPFDPCDPSFASKLNTVSRHDLPTEGDEPMVDDDAECFRENNGYPLGDESEESEDLQEEMNAEVNDGIKMDTVTPRAASPKPSAYRSVLAASTPTEGPAASVARSTVAKTTVATKPTARTRKQPLAKRLFLHRHMEDLVRMISHEELLAEDFQHMVEPLWATHGEQIVKQAMDELVSFSHRNKIGYARLKPEVVRLAVQIIGRPPSTET